MGNQHRSDFPGEEAFYRPQPYTLERKLLERRPFWQRHLPGIIASLSLILLIASSWTILALVTKQQFPPLQMLNMLKPKPANSQQVLTHSLTQHSQDSLAPSISNLGQMAHQTGLCIVVSSTTMEVMQSPPFRQSSPLASLELPTTP
jgi:hypothetical protein